MIKQFSCNNLKQNPFLCDVSVSHIIVEEYYPTHSSPRCLLARSTEASGPSLPDCETAQG